MCSSTSTKHLVYTLATAVNKGNILQVVDKVVCSDIIFMHTVRFRCKRQLQGPGNSRLSSCDKKKRNVYFGAGALSEVNKWEIYHTT